MFSVCWCRLLKTTQLTLNSLHPVLSSRHIVQLQASRGIARGCVPVSILCSVPSVRVLFLIIAHQHTYARYSRLAAAPGRQCVYVGLSRRKSPRSSACTISQKAIWFRHPDYNPDRAQRLISSSMSWRLSTCNISSKSMHALLSNLADRQTDEHGQKHVPPPLYPCSYRHIKLHRNPSITSSDIPLKCKNPV